MELVSGMGQVYQVWSWSASCMGQVYQVWSWSAAWVKCTRCGVGQLAAWVKCTRCGVGQRHGSSVPGVELVSGMGQVYQVWSWSAAWVKCNRCGGVGQLAAWVKYQVVEIYVHIIFISVNASLFSAGLNLCMHYILLAFTYTCTCTCTCTCIYAWHVYHRTSITAMPLCVCVCVLGAAVTR